LLGEVKGEDGDGEEEDYVPTSSGRLIKMNKKGE